MSPDSRYPDRRSIRLTDHDYSAAGAYFVTVCTKDRLPELDDIVVQAIVNDVWHALPSWYPTIGLDEFVIMPNHLHFIVWLGIASGARPQLHMRSQGPALPRIGGYNLPICENPRIAPTLGEVVGSMKSLVFATYLPWVRRNAPAQRASFWQRNYYDHIVRNERELHTIRRYIRSNPDRWRHDPDNPGNVSGLPGPDSIDGYLEDIARLYGAV